MGVDEPGEELSAEYVRSDVEDLLRWALHNGREDLDGRMQDVMEEAWEKGEMTGFMKGMRAGARLMLSLLGDGEILI